MMAYTATPNIQKAERAGAPLVLPSCSPYNSTPKMKTDSAEQLDAIDSLVQSATSRHLAGKERIMQHTFIAHGLEILQSGISDLTTKTRLKSKTLNGLQSRILHLKENNRSENIGEEKRPRAEFAVERELRADASLLTDFGQQQYGCFRKCDSCQKKFVLSIFDMHTAMCRKNLRRYPIPEGSQELLLNPVKDAVSHDAEWKSSTRGSLTVQELSNFQRKKCNSCGKVIRAGGITLSEHEKRCTIRLSGGGFLAAVPPRPPRNLSVKSIGPDWIDLSWDPPIIDGTRPVIDYEVAYSRVSLEEVQYTNRHASAVPNEMMTPQPTVCTANWIMKTPVNHKGYRLRGLKAGVAYTNISIRCRNNVGWGEWSDDTALRIKTTNPSPPSCPLHARLSDVTSSSRAESESLTATTTTGRAAIVANRNNVTVCWVEPMRFGGVDIPGYRLQFTIDKDCISYPMTTEETRIVEIGLEKCLTGAADRQKLRKNRVQRLGDQKTDIIEQSQKQHQEFQLENNEERGMCDSDDDHCMMSTGEKKNRRELQFTIRRLKPGIRYSKVYIWAVGSTGLEGEKTCIGDFITAPPSRRYLVAAELARAENEKTTNIDTAFYTGFMQRTKVKQHMEKLRAELDTLPEEEEEEKTEQYVNPEVHDGNDGGINGDITQDKPLGVMEQQETDKEDDVIESILPNYKQRQAQFQHRIAWLRAEIQDCDSQHRACVGKRAVISRQLGAFQSRMLEVQAEIDRISPLREVEGHVQSSVFHGSAQLFSLTSLRKGLKAELSRCMKGITDEKESLVHTNMTAKWITEKQNKLTERVAERQSAYQSFWDQSQKALKLGMRSRELLRVFKGNPADRQAHYFDSLRIHSKLRANSRKRIHEILSATCKRYLKCAMVKWVTGFHINVDIAEQHKYVIYGAGGKSLLSIEKDRRNLKTDGVRTLAMTAVAKISLKQTSNMEKKCEKNPNVTSQSLDYTKLEWLLLKELGYYNTETHNNSCLWNRDEAKEIPALANIMLGDGFQRNSVHDAALNCYRDALNDAMNEPCIIQDENNGKKLLGLILGRLGNAYILLPRSQAGHALLMFDRMLSLVEAVDHVEGRIKALEGLGRSYLSLSRHEEAIPLLQRCLDEGVKLHDKEKKTYIHGLLKNAFTYMQNFQLANLHQERINELGRNDGKPQPIQNAHEILETCHLRLVDQAANKGKVIVLETLSASLIRLREVKQELNRQKKEAMEEREEQLKVVAQKTHSVDSIQSELSIAAASCQDTMSSSLPEGHPIEYDIEELKSLLKNKLQIAEDDANWEQKKLTDNQYRVRNVEEEIKDIEEDIAVEHLPLVQASLKMSSLKHVCLNSTNHVTNEVLGSATGGVEQLIASQGSTLFCYALDTGALLFCFPGERESQRFDPQGHTKAITCLGFFGFRAVTGSLDCSVQVWQTSPNDPRRLLVLKGHEATVCCVGIDSNRVISGGADKRVIIWDVTIGEILQSLYGHNRSITCLHVSGNCLATGDADGEIWLWKSQLEIEWQALFNKGSNKQEDGGHNTQVNDGQFERHMRLSQRHLNSTVTEVAVGALEIVSGHGNGSLIVWSVEMGTAMLTIQLHEGAIRSLQFDSTRVVTAAADNQVKISDISTGNTTLTLRGHEDDVSAVAFDTDKLVSASKDGTIRVWDLRPKKNFGAKKRADRCHTLLKEETLSMVAVKYDIPLISLMHWNGIRDVRAIRPGMQLIVNKGNPSEPTEAEVAALRQKQLDEIRTNKLDAIRRKVKEEQKYIRLKELINALEDSTSLASRISRHSEEFGKLWATAVKLNRVQIKPLREQTLGGRIKSTCRNDCDDKMLTNERWGAVPNYEKQDKIALGGLETPENKELSEKMLKEIAIKDAGYILMEFLAAELINECMTESIFEFRLSRGQGMLSNRLAKSAIESTKTGPSRGRKAKY